MEKPGSRSFTTFLEGISSEAAKAERGARGDVLGALLDCLNLLAESSMTVPALQQRTGLDFGPFAETIKALKESGFVDLTGPPGRETVTITPTGRSFLEASYSKE